MKHQFGPKCVFFNSSKPPNQGEKDRKRLQKRPNFSSSWNQPENSPRLLELLFLLWTEILPFTSHHFDEVLREKRLLREFCQSFWEFFKTRYRSFTSIIELKGWTSNLSRQSKKNKESESRENHDVHHGVRIGQRMNERHSYQFFPGALISATKVHLLNLTESTLFETHSSPIPKENFMF